MSYKADCSDTVGDYDVTYAYTYDANGNITSVTDGENITTYVYDSANQLLREDNQEAGKTWIYAYDNAGNILSKAEYAYTEGSLGNALDTATYTYGNSQWGDLLTKYDGRNITYTANGNPLNDGILTYSWRHGRQLASMSDGTTTWNYTYDKDGLRLSRSNGTTTYNYVYLGGQLKRMTVGTTEIYFAYDSDGSPMAMVYNGTTYYYVKNLQGDVVGIVDKTGVQIASYSYDAWGNPLSVTSNTTANANAATIAERNPLRYRGYVYDSETGLYYLQSRYYNPEIGRFLNADGYVSTGQGLLGNNMFAYCGNNPTNLIDAMGYSAAAIALAPSVYEGFMLFLAGIASSNCWNALGWVAAAVLATGVVTTAAIYLYEIYLASNNNGRNKSNANSGSGAAASPPPPRNNKNDKDPNYRGGNTYNKGGVRVDYEYNGSMSGTGNVHVHKKGFSMKYYYDIAQSRFVDNSGAVAPKHIQDLLQIKEIVRAINRAIAYIAG